MIFENDFYNGVLAGVVLAGVLAFALRVVRGLILDLTGPFRRQSVTVTHTIPRTPWHVVMTAVGSLVSFLFLLLFIGAILVVSGWLYFGS